MSKRVIWLSLNAIALLSRCLAEFPFERGNCILAAILGSVSLSCAAAAWVLAVRAGRPSSEYQWTVGLFALGVLVTNSAVFMQTAKSGWLSDSSAIFASTVSLAVAFTIIIVVWKRLDSR